MRVECYWNLHKRVFSVRALEGPSKGRVIEHSDNIWLRDVSFVVRQAGRERVLTERRKNVHAFVRGDYVPEGERLDPHAVGTHCWMVSYNPYKAAHFTTSLGAPIHHAKLAGLVCLETGKPVIAAYEEA